MSSRSEADAARLFAVECPGCHAHVAVAGELAGRAAACPLCSAVFLVPALEADEPVVAEKPAVADEPVLFAEPPLPSTRRIADAWENPTLDAVIPAPTDRGTHDLIPPPTPAATAAPELAFREPVKTIRSGGTEIDLRRLTPEERRARRARRNLLMLVIGVAILVALVVTLGKTGR